MRAERAQGAKASEIKAEVYLNFDFTMDCLAVLYPFNSAEVDIRIDKEEVSVKSVLTRPVHHPPSS